MKATGTWGSPLRDGDQGGPTFFYLDMNEMKISNFYIKSKKKVLERMQLTVF